MANDSTSIFLRLKAKRLLLLLGIFDPLPLRQVITIYKVLDSHEIGRDVIYGRTPNDVAFTQFTQASC